MNVGPHSENILHVSTFYSFNLLLYLPPPLKSSEQTLTKPSYYEFSLVSNEFCFETLLTSNSNSEQRSGYWIFLFPIYIKGRANDVNILGNASSFDLWLPTINQIILYTKNSKIKSQFLPWRSMQSIRQPEQLSSFTTIWCIV